MNDFDRVSVNREVTWCTVSHNDATGNGYVIGYGSQGVRWSSFDYKGRTVNQVAQMIKEKYPNATGDLESCGESTGLLHALLRAMG